MTDKAINFDDEEYTIPGELLTTATAARRTVEAWPERTERRMAATENAVSELGFVLGVSAERTDQRLDAIEARLRHVETLLHQHVNAGDGCK